MNNEDLWQRFQEYYFHSEPLGLSIDISRMNFPDSFFDTMAAPVAKALAAMKDLEAGAIANPDEGRRVGHYWLRSPALAPTSEIRHQIESTIVAIEEFAAEVHSGRISGAGGPFWRILIIGIGGSALGPQFVAAALGQPGRDRLEASFFDNTDPDGMDKVLTALGPDLGRTLCIVISKSGGTKETRNGMLEARRAYEQQGLDFSRHAVAVTGVDSELDRVAAGWLRRFPMWDWVGGRTSQTSAVGLLPAALQGFGIRELLAGAGACDEVTRNLNAKKNPAVLLALMWYHAGNGKGAKDMVVLPYKDRLELFSRYLQQLVMESIGKALDLNGIRVDQGLAVYGNKGSTDQHAYVQQLRDGLDNFFVTFIQVLRDRRGPSMAVEPGVTTGDYLCGFLLGTRQALWDAGRGSITITLKEVSAFSVGVLIALYERAVGLYSSFINVNAYHQPGVEAGKKAAAAVLRDQEKILAALASDSSPMTVSEIATKAGVEPEGVFYVCEHLSGNPDRNVTRSLAEKPADNAYRLIRP